MLQMNIKYECLRYYKMTNLYGSFGQPVGPGGPGGGLAEAEDPIFVPAEVFYKNKQWYRTGIRFKGNSSLRSSWQRGILKLSLKLDFDEFETGREVRINGSIYDEAGVSNLSINKQVLIKNKFVRNDLHFDFI